MTKPTKPRPVVRVVIEFYPREPNPRDTAGIGDVMRDAIDDYDRVMDYRRPRVVSVRRVRARRA